MAKIPIIYQNSRTGESVELDVSAFVELVIGTSIKTLAHADNFVEFGLSDALNMMVQDDGVILLRPTTNEGEMPPIRFDLGSEGERFELSQVESIIHNFRQLYAISYVVGQEDSALYNDVLLNGDSDLELLIPPEDRLFVEAISAGSLWTTVTSKTDAAYRSVKRLAPVFFSETRSELIERIRLSTEDQRLSVEERRSRIEFANMNETVDLYQKIAQIPDEAVRNRMEEMVRDRISAIEEEATKSLPGPPSTPRLGKI